MSVGEVEVVDVAAAMSSRNGAREKKLGVMRGMCKKDLGQSVFGTVVRG